MPNNINKFPSGESTIILQGPEGNLETLTSAPQNDTDKGIAIICHPDPMQDGTMHNKVVYMMAKTLGELGLKTIRFNYRGVGKSEGSYGHTKGEIEDLLSVMDWVNQTSPGQPLWLAGFSFGSYVVASAANQRPKEVAQLITVAPGVKRWNFFNLKQVECPWLVIQGDQDDVASPDATVDWAHKMEPKPNLVMIPSAGHFFHGRLLDLRHVLEMELRGE